MQAERRNVRPATTEYGSIATMRYIQHILQPGERLAHSAKIHWIIYVPGLVLVVLALVLAIWARGLAGSANAALDALALLVAVAGLVWLAAAWVKRFSTEIDVTDRRVVYKRGLIRRHTVEMNMDKVESVDVDQSILGRILNYGDVTVRGTGVTLERVPMVQAPIAFRNQVTAR
jgi:uncharacterized membrane protein YdbT with pleckstrin-like domain